MLVRILEQQGRVGLLAEGVVYASCEPCPMCVGAMFWAGARNVVYGLSSAQLIDLATAPGADRFGFTITAPEIGRAASPAMILDGPHREDEASAPHRAYWF
jgi:tRNA(Arg) A34 adenosine deaminase TadA